VKLYRSRGVPTLSETSGPKKAGGNQSGEKATWLGPPPPPQRTKRSKKGKQNQTGPEETGVKNGRTRASEKKKKGQERPRDDY